MFKYKIFLSAFLVLFLSAQSALFSNAFYIPVDIEINDRYIKTDAEPTMINDSVYVPARCIAENLGADITWDDASGTTTVTLASKTISLTRGKDSAVVNGQTKTMTGPMCIINNRTMIPVRFLAQELGADVSWNATFYTVELKKSGVSVDAANIKGYGADEVLWLSRIIEAEASGESITGKIAVGNVVLNRVKSNEFPDTIYGVIFDKTYGVQFEPVSSGAIINTPSAESAAAAKRALSGESAVGDCLYFLNPQKAQSLWITENRQYHSTIENHDFYL